MDKTWIVVAHQEQARIFAHNRAGERVALLKSLEHPEGRLKIHERVSDRQGRKFRGIDSSRSGVTTPVLPDEKDAMDFARTVAYELKRARVAGDFLNAVIVAGPHFLGLIRKFLDRSTENRVAACVPKNLAKMNAREITREIAEALDDADRAAIAA